MRRTHVTANSGAAIDRRGFLKAAAVGLAIGAQGRLYAQAAAPAARPVGPEAQLFLDDWIVERLTGLERRFHPAAKKGLIQEADGKPWDRGDAISVVRDPRGRFHITYRLLWWDSSVRDLHGNIGEDKAHWHRDLTGYAVSDDGVRWSKPRLGLVEGPVGFRRAPESKWKDGMFEEPTGFSKETNLGCPIASVQDLGEFGAVGNPRRRYLINIMRKSDTHAFAGITESGLYFGPDVPDLKAAEWRKRLEPIWEGTRGGSRGGVAGYDEASRLWFGCNQSHFGAFQARGGRDISRWTSKDLIEWSEPELVLPIAADESKDPKDWVEYMAIGVFRVADVWLGTLLIYHGDRSTPQSEMPTAKGVWRKGTTELRLVMSRDAGKTWQRVGGKQPWIPYHEEENGFDRMVFLGRPVRVGEELWFYYSAWDGDHLTWNRDGTTYYKDRVRIGRTARATCRWDGFVSLRAGESAGEILTRPFLARGRRLTINAAAARGGIRAELQTADGLPIGGYALADCTPATGDGIAQPVRWRGGESLAEAAAGRPIRLRFDIRQADLYGFRCLA